MRTAEEWHEDWNHGPMPYNTSVPELIRMVQRDARLAEAQEILKLVESANGKSSLLRPQDLIRHAIRQRIQEIEGMEGKA